MTIEKEIINRVSKCDKSKVPLVILLLIGIDVS